MAKDDMDKETRDFFGDVVKRYDAETLTPSPECAEMTEHFEGFSSTPYRDSAGHITWGIGETVGVDPNGTISHDEAVERFLERLEEDYAHWVGKRVNVPLTQYEFDALSCWTYNLGVGSLSNSTMLKKLNQGDYESAAEELLRWDKARVDGELVSLAGLTRRRNAEYTMFKGGDWRDFYE